MLMKRFLLIILLLLPSVSLAAIAHVQTVANGAGCTATTCAQGNFSSAVTAGNMIVFGCMVGDVGRTLTGSDTLVNTFVTDITLTDTVDGGQLSVGHAYNISGGTDNFSCNTSGGAINLRTTGSEFSGAATSAALDKMASTTSSGTAIATGAVTPSANGELLYVVERTSATATCTVGTDFTRISQVPADSPSTRMCAEYYVQPTAASHDGTWTVGAGLTWAVAMATFKAAASAASVITPKYIYGGSGVGKFVFTGGKFTFQ